MLENFLTKNYGDSQGRFDISVGRLRKAVAEGHKRALIARKVPPGRKADPDNWNEPNWVAEDRARQKQRNAQIDNELVIAKRNQILADILNEINAPVGVSHDRKSINKRVLEIEY